MKIWFILLVLIASLAFVAGCSDTTPAEQQSSPTPTPIPTVKQTVATKAPATTIPTATPTPALTVATYTVTISGNTFTPAELTIKAGSQVRWVNADEHPHRVSFPNAGFTAFLLASGQSSSQQFDRAGVYDYTDLIYSSMHGRVTVVK